MIQIPESVQHNGLDRCIQFLNESNQIETIKEIDYHDQNFRQPDKGHFGAFILSQQSALARQPLTPKLIKQWQALLTQEQILFHHAIKDEEIGHIRGPNLQKNVTVGKHIPPTWENVPNLLQMLIEDINEGLKDLDKLSDDAEYCKFLGSVFQQFESIHPFADGNGRTGRLMVNYIATYCNRPIIIFNSEMIERNRYYEAHVSKKDMCCFMATKMQEAIFGESGKLLLKTEQLSGSSCRYISSDNQETEIYEWHKLVNAWEPVPFKPKD